MTWGIWRSLFVKLLILVMQLIRTPKIDEYRKLGRKYGGQILLEGKNITKHMHGFQNHTI